MGKKIILFAAFIFLSGPAFAGAPGAPPEPAQAGLAVDTGKSSSGLPIPRFVSLAADKVFVRTGPALRYPIKWVYARENMPVEIIQEFDTWRKIRDMDGDDGWVHQSLLSGDRYGIVKGEANLGIRKDPSEKSRITAFYEPNVVTSIDECQAAWCHVMTEGYDGWVQRKFLWGIYDSEDFD
jgi:SH3-like domain-containing protein